MGISIRIYPLVISCSGETQCFFSRCFFFKGFPVVFPSFSLQHPAHKKAHRCRRSTSRAWWLPRPARLPLTQRRRWGDWPHHRGRGPSCRRWWDPLHHPWVTGTLRWELHLKFIWISTDLIWSYLILSDLVWSRLVLPYLVLSIISTISTPSYLIHPIPSNPSTYLSIHLSLFQCPTHMYDYVYIYNKYM